MGGLKEIVFEAKRETYCVEETMIGGIIIPLIKIYSYDVYIYMVVERIFHPLFHIVGHVE